MPNSLTRRPIDRSGLRVLACALWCLLYFNSTGSGNNIYLRDGSLSKQIIRPVFAADSTQKPRPSTLVIKVFASDITQPLASATAVITSTITSTTNRFVMLTGRLERTFLVADQLSIDISAPGYTSINRRMAIPVSPQGNRYEFDAVLDRITIGLTVSAVDRQTGHIIPGVRFSISGQPMGSKSLTLTANSGTGLSKATLPGKGIYVVSSTVSGYANFVKSVQLDSLQNEARFILAAQRAPAEPAPIAQPPAQPVSGVADKPSPTAGAGPIINPAPLVVPEKGRSIALPAVHFDQSSPVLRPESYPELDQLYEFLNRNSALRIDIRGHTDNQGDFDLNVKLSRDRCQAIIDYLVGKGIAHGQLKATGRGPIDPIAPNNNEENRKKNRRVEFVVM